MSDAKNLAALYNHAKPQGMGFLHYDPKPLSEAQADAILAKRRELNDTYFDYMGGRVMKIDVTKLEKVLGYERDNGSGSVAKALSCPGCRKCVGPGIPAYELM